MKKNYVFTFDVTWVSIVDENLDMGNMFGENEVLGTKNDDWMVKDGDTYPYIKFLMQYSDLHNFTDAQYAVSDLDSAIHCMYWRILRNIEHNVNHKLPPYIIRDKGYDVWRLDFKTITVRNDETGELIEETRNPKITMWSERGYDFSKAGTDSLTLKKIYED